MVSLRNGSLHDQFIRDTTFYSCRLLFQVTGQLKYWKQHHTATRLTFRGWQTSPFRLLSIFPAETEVNFPLFWLFWLMYLSLGENHSCPKRLKSKHTNNSHKLSDCSTEIQLTISQHNLPIWKNIPLVMLPFWKSIWGEKQATYLISKDLSFFSWGRQILFPGMGIYFDCSC